jgi:hypothetical protein
MCAIEGCSRFPVWEIVWSNGRLYDVCDDHAGVPAPWSIEEREDGSLHGAPIDVLSGPELSVR